MHVLSMFGLKQAPRNVPYDTKGVGQGIKSSTDEAIVLSHPRSKAFSLFVRLALLLMVLVQFSGCPTSTLRVANAEQLTETITSTTSSFNLTGFDAQGTEITHFNEPTAYLDSHGRVYKCMNPHKTFLAGTFVKQNASIHLDDETIKRCALAQEWCSENVENTKSSVVTQVFIWKILTTAGLFPRDEVVDWQVEGFDIAEAYARFETWYTEHAKRFIGYSEWWTAGNGYQDLARFWVEESVGSLKLIKSSTQADIVSFSSSYSLSGARYEIWNDKELTKPADVDALETDEKGISNTVELAAGTYWIRESKAPEGFILDTNVYEVEVKSGETTELKVNDKPFFETPDIWVHKHDGLTASTSQGSASLEGARFAICYYPESYAPGTYTPETLPIHSSPQRTWLVISDDKGKVKVSDDNKAGGDDFFKIEDKVVLPFGTVTIQEVEAPKGYLLEGQKGNDDTYKAPIHVLNVSESKSFSAPVIIDEVRRAGIIIRKVDADTKDGPQGAASLAGVTFDIICACDNPITVLGTSYSKDQVICSITTDESGVAKTSESLLPPGIYQIREKSANPTMTKSDTTKTVTIDAGDADTFVSAGTFEDTVVRGGVRVQKVSRETLRDLPQGSATLAHAQLSVTLLSDNPVIVNGATYHTGDVVCLLDTDDTGIASTGDHVLPYGSYLIEEIVAPQGYLLDSDWSAKLDIMEDGKVYDFTSQDNILQDQVMRGGFRFTKVDEQTKDVLPNIPFSVTSMTTGERHLIVTNEDGVADTERVTHSHITNTCDLAIKADGSVDTDLLLSESGIWFSGRADTTVKVDDEVGALPYDTYVVEELPCPSNADKVLTSFFVEITKDQAVCDLGVIENIRKPDIKTSLTYLDGSHEVPAAEEITVTDTITYCGLTPGVSYTLRGSLVPKAAEAVVEGDDMVENKDGDEPAASAETTFTPSRTYGTERVTFIVSTTSHAGGSLVAYEEVYDGEERVAYHCDMNDESQTIHIPAISTKLTDMEGGKEIGGSGELSLIDHVEYSNLTPNLAYEVIGTLMDKDTGAAITNASGETIHATTTITPDEPNGTCEVSFVIDAALVTGKRVVAYEKLLRSGMLLSSHEDIEDEDQTITVPSIKTELSDVEGHHTIKAQDELEIIDTVSYAGLIPGQTYNLIGSLVDAQTKEPLLDGEGIPIESQSDFKPEKEQGTSTVKFKVKGSSVAGRRVVAYEKLLHDDVEIASHADPSDEAQTVYIPAVVTELTTISGSHEATSSDHLILTDQITYSGLRPNIPYTASGILVNAETGAKITDAKGHSLTATADFTPDKATGTYSVTFELDTTQISASKIVAFETIREGRAEGARIIAAHEDVHDDRQTIALKKSDEPEEERKTDNPNDPKTTTQQTAKPATTTATTTSGSTPASGVRTASYATPGTGDTLVVPTAIILMGLTFVAGSILLRLS